MLAAIHPKLPMRNKALTRDFYTRQLGFRDIGSEDFDGYLILERDQVQIHFFAFPGLDPSLNYGQVYIRTTAIDDLYKSLMDSKTAIHPGGKLQNKPWGQREFAVLDPDNNLLTFGSAII